MPFFFICIYNDILKILNRELEEVFPVQLQNERQSWEIFVANHDAFRTNLLIKRGKKSARLGELYRGAYGTQKTLDIEVELKELSVYYANKQFPCEKLMDKESNSIIDWVKGENVIVNGASSAFVVRAEVQNNNQYILILHQCKYGLSGMYYTVESLLKGYIKNLESSENTTEELRKILSQCQHITIVFTIQPFNSTDNCFVIMKSNFKEYFGPIFASCATFYMIPDTFYMTKDINPNFLDCSWMKNDLTRFGEATAELDKKSSIHPFINMIKRKFQIRL
ncbi:hypothetical protein RhiirA4_506330 [Rhizophagus irregularis]|uniref:Crinkler family protein n=1 Tax=Rhizophagus irregularis TaxID=588596 RepID=A0A2I1HB43_9GLOM|nr:hypothetical protein RhiirA4_506330 [Rhizophagus irregularis]